MDVQWTWRLVGKLIGVVFLCTMAMLGTYGLGVWLGLNPEVAGLISLGVWVANFFAIEPVRSPITNKHGRARAEGEWKMSQRADIALLRTPPGCEGILIAEIV